MNEEFILTYVTDWELEKMGWLDAQELAIERDNQASNELEAQFNGSS